MHSFHSVDALRRGFLFPLYGRNILNRAQVFCRKELRSNWNRLDSYNLHDSRSNNALNTKGSDSVFGAGAPLSTSHVELVT